MASFLNSSTAFFKYTKGKEFALDTEEYIGEYHYQGKDAYTGPKPSKSAEKLSKYHPAKQVLIYNKLMPKKKSILTYAPPTKGLIYPSDDELQAGEMMRFFVQNRLDKNEIIEIDHDQAKHYSKDYGIDPVLYQYLELPWKITKNEKQLKAVGFENAKQVLKANKEMIGIANSIFSYIEFSEVII